MPAKIFRRKKVKPEMSSHGEKPPKARTKEGKQDVKNQNMKQLIRLKSAVIPWLRGPVRYPSLARVFLLAPALFACLALSQTARAANPAPGSRATSASDGASDGVQNFSNTALLRPEPTIITFDVPGAGT